MDEDKTGLRIRPGSVCERIGLVPDMITVSKALGNGYPVAATLGTRQVMQAGAGMHYSATFHGETTAMAAALTTLRLCEQEAVPAHVEALGQRLIDGLNEMVSQLGVSGIAFGEPLPAMPFFKLTEPDAAINQRLTQAFYREALAGGHLLHPRHLWFLSGAHSEADVDATLATCRAALKHALDLCRNG
jgi:glutamate-1-semialdehyde 2,1-aminomutase